MIPLAIGLGILGFVAMRHARRCHPACGGHGHPWRGWRHYHHHHHHRHAWHRRWMLHAALARLDTSPAQERAIIAELDRVEDHVHTAGGTLRDARRDLAATVRGSTLDDAALGAALGRLDGAVGEVRAAALEALRNIHAVLDDRQRARLADLLDGGGGLWHGGPYR